MFFKRKHNDETPESCVKRSGKISSLDIVTVNISAMRYVVEYEIVNKNGTAEISLYDIRFSKEEDRRVLRKRAECGIDVITELLNKCGAVKWDGFCGANPKGVRDGKMFRLTAKVNGGERIYASGSNNYPKNFLTFIDTLDGILRDEGKPAQEN